MYIVPKTKTMEWWLSFHAAYRRQRKRLQLRDTATHSSQSSTKQLNHNNDTLRSLQTCILERANTPKSAFRGRRHPFKPDIHNGIKHHQLPSQANATTTSVNADCGECTTTNDWSYSPHATVIRSWHVTHSELRHVDGTWEPHVCIASHRTTTSEHDTNSLQRDPQALFCDGGHQMRTGRPPPPTPHCNKNLPKIPHISNNRNGKASCLNFTNFLVNHWTQLPMHHLPWHKADQLPLPERMLETFLRHL